MLCHVSPKKMGRSAQCQPVQLDLTVQGSPVLLRSNSSVHRVQPTQQLVVSCRQDAPRAKGTSLRPYPFVTLWGRGCVFVSCQFVFVSCQTFFVQPLPLVLMWLSAPLFRHLSWLSFACASYSAQGIHPYRRHHRYHSPGPLGVWISAESEYDRTSS